MLFFSPPFQTLGLMPWEGFVTTYSSDYKPFSERQPQVSQLKPRTEAKAAPAFINPPQVGWINGWADRYIDGWTDWLTVMLFSQTDRESWPIFHQYFYKTTNSIYGSSGCSQVNSTRSKFTIVPFIFWPAFCYRSHSLCALISQPPPSSLFPASFHPFGILAPSVSEASLWDVGSALTEARTQEARVARETGPLLGQEEKGQLRYVFGGKGKEFSLWNTVTHMHTHIHTHLSWQLQWYSVHLPVLTANAWGQQEAKDEPQQKIDVLYEEG